ncbi:MAG: peptide chain release factor N(5)-glutamine methyltransferase [Actinomycetota bacterium]
MLARIESTLAEAGIETAAREARWLLEAATGERITELYAKSEELPGPVVERAVELTGRRVSGAPLQYVTGVAGFRRLELAVGPGVLIPRPETEVVAERAIQRLPSRGIIVDVGTGSGAIALSIADERPDARVYGTEISETAIEWAQRNVSTLRLSIELVRGDLFDGLPPELAGEVDVVVSNPPYVAVGDADALPTEVVDHEPAEALFAGEEGLQVIADIAMRAREWLRPGGWLILEIGFAQSEAVLRLLTNHDYAQVAAHPDLSGHLRVAEGRHR